MGSIHEENDDDSFQIAMQLASVSILPMVLKSAVELDLFEMIARAGPGAYVSPSDLAAQLPTKNPAAAAVLLERILRLLTSYSILTCKPNDNSYGLAPVTKFLIKNEDGVSLAPIVLLNHEKVVTESWHNINDAVLNGGIPFVKTHGMSIFEYMGIDPRVKKVFHDGMSNASTLTMKKILQLYKGFQGLTGTIVDVGGGTGATLNMIISKYPKLKGINFDMPQVIQNAPSYPGVDHVGGDMFASIPKGDVIFMKWICHNWSDEDCLKFLKNCYDALPIDGKLVVADFSLPTTIDSSLKTQNVTSMDIRMFTMFVGGKERTHAEFEVLARGAGFQGFSPICCAYNTSIMEFYKNI